MTEKIKDENRNTKICIDNYYNQRSTVDVWDVREYFNWVCILKWSQKGRQIIPKMLTKKIGPTLWSKNELWS